MSGFVSTAVKKKNCLVSVHIFILILLGNFHLTIEVFKGLCVDTEYFWTLSEYYFEVLE